MHDTATNTVAQAGPVNLHDHVIASVRAMVLHGELVAGRRVPESMLCQRLGISRTPLREALKVLAAEGFVELRPNRGAIVSPIDHGAVADLFEVKGALERTIGLCLPARITPDQLQRIRGLHVAMGLAMQGCDTDRYTDLNDRFHAELAAGTQNKALITIYAQIQRKILRARFVVNEQPQRLQHSLAEHEQIVAMLQAGAALDLAECLDQHNRRTAQAILFQLKSRADGSPC